MTEDMYFESESSPPRLIVPSLQTIDEIVHIKRNVRRKYLLMVMIAYVLTLTLPGTVLWSPMSSSFSSSSLSHSIVSDAVDNPPSHTPSETMNSATNSPPKIVEMMTTNTTTVMDNTQTSDERNHNYTTSNNDYGLVQITRVDGIASTINIILLIKLTCYTIVLIGLFLNLQGSNPGLLNKDTMSRLEDDPTISESDDNECNPCEGCDEEYKEADIELRSFLDPFPQKMNDCEDEEGSPPPVLPTPQHNTPTIRTTSRPRHIIIHPSGYCNPHTRRKYCHICHIHPPIRSHHCKICQTCVATFDHHCIFLGTCIGERNHFRFWLFVCWNFLCFHLALGIVNSSHAVSRSGYGIVDAVLTFLGFHHDDDKISRTWDVSITQIVLLITNLYMYPLYGMAILLLIVHSVNALGNCTTFELTKGPDHIDYLVNTKMMDFPFGNGVLSNLRTFVVRDDIVSRCLFWWRRKLNTAMLVDDIIGDNNNEFLWKPILWKMPTSIDRESEDWWNHPWQNKYWSCC